MNNIEDLYALSPMQEGMLFHTLYSPESEAYFEQLICQLKGQLNISFFQKAWQTVVARHPVLRSSFHWEEIEKPLQMVSQQIELSWMVHDWQHWEKSKQKEGLETFLKSDRSLGIELDQAPLMRFTLIKLGINNYQFIWSHHHILLDGWSMQIVLHEVFELYESYHRGESLQLKYCPPYREYISWLQQQNPSEAKNFWQEKLQGIEAPTPLTVGQLIKNNTQEEAYKEIPFKLSLEVTEKLKSLAQKHHLTLNNLVQGAWGLLLSRYSGETDIIFGATVSGRPSNFTHIEQMVGLFINTLPIRLTVSDQEELIPWLKELQRQQFEQEPYSYYSLAEIQKYSDIPPKMSLFESILVFENYPGNSDKNKTEKTLEITDIRCLERTNYPLTVVIIPNRELSGRIVYDIRRFEAETIERMIGHLQTLLEGMTNHPEQNLSQFSLLTQAEKEALISEENQNDAEIKTIDYQCVHRLFEQQVDKTPDAVAIVYKNQQLTYQELNQKANQLAHYLESLGIKLEDRIGICIERSPLIVIAILAVLKVGGAYVPLDPAYPSERLGFILQDAGIALLITEKSLLSLFSPSPIQLICLHDHILEQQATSNPINDITPCNLAYVIYTSGSTGRPKGVLVTHGNVTRLFAVTQPLYNFNGEDVGVLFHSYAFDFSVWEIWSALFYGGRLVIVPYLVTRSPEIFYKLLCQEKVSILNQTPSAFRQLVAAEEALGESGENLHLRYLIFGGESLDFSCLKPWFDKHGDNHPQLVNMYGITETTVHVTYYRVTMEDLERQGNIIGSPLADLEVYVLDKHLQPQPLGIPGELYVGGEGVARGYLNRPQLSEERFISHPWGKGKLYKTGDRGRYLPDGSLQYLGRIDHQVKIRGFRIELGEIETILTNHSDLKEAIIIIREDQPGNKSIVAYLIPHNHQLTSHDVRNYLIERLPNYMIPNAFVFLDKFPLTPNGKINRRALPIPDSSQSNFGVEFVPPRNSTEEELATIWSEVLQLKQVGIYDNFFELGGHSLLATQVISRLKETFEIEFPFRYLFENPTIVELAEKVTMQQLEQVQDDELSQILEEIDQLSEEEAAEKLRL